MGSTPPTLTQPPTVTSKIVDTKEEALAKIITFLKIFSFYKLVMLTFVAVYCLIDDQKIIATLAIVSLFSHILYAKGLQERWIVILRSYQVFYLIFATLMTTLVIVDALALIRGVSGRYIRFFFWISLVLPTLPSIYIINQLINILYAIAASENNVISVVSPS
uniref:Uncharacterized protein n=1 Tax=Tetranychus urticae TaxID=32264 RepID=T1KRR0_TETUR